MTRHLCEMRSMPPGGANASGLKGPLPQKTKHIALDGAAAR